MLVRTETPDAWLTCGLERARRTTSSTIFGHEARHFDVARRCRIAPSRRSHPRVLLGDLHSLVDRLGIMRADDRADSVLQRRDDSAAIGVVLGVGAEDKADVEIEPDRVAADLHVAFFQHVEQAHLNSRGQIGQLVDREDSAIAARDQPEVHRRFVRQISSLGMLHQIDLADQVGDRHVRRRQFFVIAVRAMHPFDLGIVSLLGDQALAAAGRGRNRIVVDVESRKHRHPFIEQIRKHPKDARLGLSAKAEEQQVVLGEDAVDDLGDDGVAISDDSGRRVPRRT